MTYEFPPKIYREQDTNEIVGLLPAIAIPIESKNEFECPSDHLDTLIDLIPFVDKILVIGWRATEKPFLQLLANNLSQEVRGMVVSESSESTKATIDNIKGAGIKCEFNSSFFTSLFGGGSGFTPFIVSRSLDGFLNH